MDRSCLVCGADLSDLMGCYVFVSEGGQYVHRNGSDEKLLCVACNEDRGGNVFSVAEYDRCLAAEAGHVE
jgi:hypothetical protein